MPKYKVQAQFDKTKVANVFVLVIRRGAKKERQRIRDHVEANNVGMMGMTITWETPEITTPANTAKYKWFVKVLGIGPDKKTVIASITRPAPLA